MQPRILILTSCLKCFDQKSTEDAGRLIFDCPKEIADDLTTWFKRLLLLPLFEYLRNRDGGTSIAETSLLVVRLRASAFRTLKSFVERFGALVVCFGALILSSGEIEMISEFLQMCSSCSQGYAHDIN